MEELCRYIRQLRWAFVGMTRGCDTLCYRWAARKLCQGNVLAFAFALRSKLVQLAFKSIGPCFLTISLRLHVSERFFGDHSKLHQADDIVFSHLALMVTSTSASSLLF